MTLHEIANDNPRFDDERDVKDRQVAAIAAAAEYRGRPDLIELAMASNAWIGEFQRQVLALNHARSVSATETEQEFHRRHIKLVLAQSALEARRFDAIEAAMDEATLVRFWEQVGVPSRV